MRYLNQHSAFGVRIERSQRRDRDLRLVRHGNDLAVKQGHVIAFFERLALPGKVLTNRFGDALIVFLVVHGKFPPTQPSSTRRTWVYSPQHIKTSVPEVIIARARSRVETNLPCLADNPLECKIGIISPSKGEQSSWLS